jgi:excinuclease ABC subunit A
MIEHNPYLLKKAAHIIDLGNVNSNSGGELIYQGNINNIVKCKKSLTAKIISN